MLNEEARSLQRVALLRIVLFSIALLWVVVESPFSGNTQLFEIAAGVFFILTSIAHYWAAKRQEVFASKQRQDQAMSRGEIYLSRWPIFTLFAVDIISVGLMFSVMDAIASVDVAPTWLFRFSILNWLLVFVAQAALSLEWRYVAWSGFWVVFVRGAQYFHVLSQPGTFHEGGIDFSDPQNFFDALFDPNFVSLSNATNELIAIVGITAILSIAVSRAKRLTRKQAQAERQRGALARYFSPNIVDHVTGRDAEFTAPVKRDVAVMFVDIVHFTKIAERRTAEQTVELLKEFYARMAAIVFEHGGTLDKYLGDGLMVTFNTPVAAERPAYDAVRCAIAMLTEVDAWSPQAGEPAIDIGIGIHWGEVVTGDIGDARRLEYAVIGDTVNVASRLEALTRQHAGWLIISQDLRQKMASELAGAPSDDLPTGCFSSIGAIEIRGRSQPVEALSWQGGETENA